MLDDIRVLGGSMEIPRDRWPEANNLRRDGLVELTRAHVSIQHPGKGRNFKTVSELLSNAGAGEPAESGEARFDRQRQRTGSVRLDSSERTPTPGTAGRDSYENEDPEKGGAGASPALVLLEAWKAQTYHDQGADDEGRRAPSAIERTYCYGTGWRECRRAMCLDLLHPEDTTFEGETLEKFRNGGLFEDATILHLKAGGRRVRPRFRLTSEQQKVRIRDRQGRAVIVGKTDDTLVFDHEHGKRRPMVMEIKGGESVRNVREVDDLLRGKYTKGYPRQLLSYLLALSIESGVMVLKRPGWPTILDVHLEGRYGGQTGYEIAEDFQQRAERAVACKLDGADLPDYHGDPSVCLRCDHRGRSCAPPLDAGQGMKLIMDYGLTECARDVVEKKEAARDFNAGKRRLREAFGGELRLPLVNLRGRYMVTGKPAAKTWTDKKTGKKTTDPEGRWLQEVEALPGAREPEEQDLTSALEASLAALPEKGATT